MIPILALTLSNDPSNNKDVNERNDEISAKVAGPHIPNSIFELSNMVFETASLCPFINVSARTLAMLL